MKKSVTVEITKSDKIYARTLFGRMLGFMREGCGLQNALQRRFGACKEFPYRVTYKLDPNGKIRLGNDGNKAAIRSKYLAGGQCGICFFPPEWAGQTVTRTEKEGG